MSPELDGPLLLLYCPCFFSRRLGAHCVWKTVDLLLLVDCLKSGHCLVAVAVSPTQQDTSKPAKVYSKGGTFANYFCLFPQRKKFCLFPHFLWLCLSFV
jgi:hypothetical protein